MYNTVNRRRFLGAITAGGIVSIGGCVTSQEDTYPGQSIEFMIPNPPGGGNDTYVRALSPALSDALDVDVNPINETPLEQTIPELYESGEDGYKISIVSPTILATHIVEDGPDTPLNPANWHSLGAPVRSSLILVASADSGLESWDQLVERSEDGEVFLAALIGVGLDLYYNIIGRETVVEFEEVTGYEGTGEIIGDLERGDVDFFIGPAESLLPFVDDGICVPILTNDPDIMEDDLLNNYAEIGHEGIAETTYAEAGMENLGTLTISIRACLAPPGVPDDRVEILRDGLWEASTSDQFAEQAAESNIPVDPLTAEELDDLLEEKEHILTEL